MAPQPFCLRGLRRRLLLLVHVGRLGGGVLIIKLPLRTSRQWLKVKTDLWQGQGCVKCGFNGGFTSGGTNSASGILDQVLEHFHICMLDLFDGDPLIAGEWAPWSRLPRGCNSTFPFCHNHRDVLGQLPNFASAERTSA